MKTLPTTPESIAVERRVVWFEEPERALADPVQLLAHVMVFGTTEDLKALRGVVTKDDYRDVLEHAPPGIFDPPSWAYWNLVYGRHPVPPLPVRSTLPGKTLSAKNRLPQLRARRKREEIRKRVNPAG
jgi:hypothetical protein